MKTYANGIVRLLEGTIDLSTIRSISNPFPEIYLHNGREYYSGKFFVKIGFNCIEQTTFVALFLYDGLENRLCADAAIPLSGATYKAEQEYEILISEWAKTIR